MNNGTAPTWTQDGSASKLITELTEVSAQLAADDVMHWVRDFVHERLPRCESPIEAYFLAAVAPYIVVSEEYTLRQQVEIDRYRVDFVIGFWEDDPESGVKVIVECDGHDYHERTKAQAARDKKRDRILARNGYSVLRFTGSELWKDAASCAEEVIGFTQKDLG